MQFLAIAVIVGLATIAVLVIRIGTIAGGKLLINNIIVIFNAFKGVPLALHRQYIRPGFVFHTG
jgi:hypothetical protein